jgi:catechol 2,3-dioxygenase-like lactoylglutathione lyase family enzyme
MKANFAPCLALVALAATASAEPAPKLAPPTERRAAAAATGAFFALSVADLGASEKWYTERLGLRVVMRVPRQNGASVVVLESDGLIVELIQHDDAVPLGTAAPAVKDNMHVHGLVKAGVIVPDFDATLAMLKARNVEIAFGPYPKRQGQRANVIVRDNAGNLIQFFGS